jgi:hypothetical protein
MRYEFWNKTVGRYSAEHRYHRVREKREGRERNECKKAKAIAALFGKKTFFIAALGAVDIIGIYRVTANRFSIFVIIFNVIFHIVASEFYLVG